MPAAHLVSTDNLTDRDVERLFARADVFARTSGLRSSRLADRLVAVLFYEPSTRTRLSFETAVMRLGGHTMGFSDIRSSSVTKGETLRDTIRIVSSYADGIIMRHPHAGAAQLATDNASVAFVNAGDGPHLHPTQTLTDLFFLRRDKGRIEGLTVALCGDLLAGRTVHSLATALARFGARCVCVAPRQLGMPTYVSDEVTKRYGGVIEYVDRIEDCLAEIDVLYMTRLQRERLPVELKDVPIPRVDAELLAKMRPDTAILHPLPRVDEITQEVDDDPRAAYFRQAAGGVLVRMALLDLMLSDDEFARAEPPFTPVTPPDAYARCANQDCVMTKEPGVPHRPVVTPWNDRPRCAFCEHALEQGTLPLTRES